jgi:hypothetical protein
VDEELDRAGRTRVSGDGSVAGAGGPRRLMVGLCDVGHGG